MKRLKQTYESPLMWRTLVELEDGFCAASADVTNLPKQGGIKADEVNTGFDIDFTKNSDTYKDSWD